MRRKTRDNIIDLFYTIKEGMDYIKAENISLEVALSIGSDSYDALVCISNLIEEELSDERASYYCTFLDELKEEINQLNNKISGKLELGRLCSKIIENINALQEILKNENEVKLEVLFLPYKASMWDSLESLWKAASEHERINAYVMPIPYYDKNPDGTFKRMNYEGDKFPNDINIVDWTTYDLEKKHPDIIFIHNPYDEGNRVTSIHPNFYSRNLRENTDMLVYVPYFILGDNIYEHFCVFSGVLLSDRVIVQSEKAREVYIKCFRQLVKNNNLEHIFNEEVIQNKFKALGSPKVDKAVNCNREDFILPDQWREKIKDKKVVLYNTGLSELLEGKGEQLNKIEDVLATFKNRQDVILWWRPHPLTAATNESMHPELLNKYNNIVDRYKKDNFGIFDDTEDLYRAIAYTDMYYGDESSLVHLYGLQGKPIMIQNHQVLLNDENAMKDKTIYFYDCAIEDNRLWFVAGNYNSLYEMDMNSGKVNLLGRIPNEDGISLSLYANMFKVGDNIWMIPSRAKEIAKYNLIEKKFSKIKLKEGEGSKTEKFYSAHLYENKIYMIPWNFEGIVCLNLEDESIRIDDSFINYLNEKYNYDSNTAYVRKSCMVGEKIYMPIYETDIVIEYNVKNKLFKEYCLNNKNIKVSSIVHDGYKFWLIPRLSGMIVSWNKNDNEVKVYNKYPSDFENINLFRFSYYKDGHVWLFPELGNMIIRLDINTGEMEGICKTQGKYYCSFAYSDNDLLLTASSYGRRNTEILMINTDGEIIDRKKVECEEVIDFKEDKLFDCIKDAKYKKTFEYYLYENMEGNIIRALDELNRGNYYIDDEKDKYLDLYSNSTSGAGSAILEKCFEEFGI